jgi:4-carboxymuconolactone decarboxylase
MTMMSNDRDTQPAADSTLREKGRAMRRKLVGDAFADRLDQGLYADPIMEKYGALTQELIFGML